jgi:hypothetical protein
VTESERYDWEEIVIMMADYNGWTDEREEEREALDQFEMTLAAASKRRRLLRLRRLLVRAAAREILARSSA